MRRRLLWVFAGLTLLVGVILGWIILRPKNDPRIIGIAPNGLVLVPRSQFISKPWFSLPWFGGAKIQYPPGVDLPEKWKDDPELAGYFLWKLPTWSAGERAGATFVYSRWTLPDGRFYGISANDQAFASCPYVYGDSPRQLEVSFTPSTMHFFGGVRPPPFKIELPPNGLRPPKLNRKEAKVGGITVIVDPVEPISPLFEHGFVVSAVGLKPGEYLLLAGYPGNAREARAICVGKDKPAQFTTASPNIEFKVQVATMEQTRVRVSTSAVSGQTIYAIKDGYGKTLLKGKSVGPRMGWEIEEKGITPMQIAGEWVGMAFDLQTSGDFYMFWGRVLAAEFPIIPVGTHDAKVYRVTKTSTLNLTGLFP